MQVATTVTVTLLNIFCDLESSVQSYFDLLLNHDFFSPLRYVNWLTPPLYMMYCKHICLVQLNFTNMNEQLVSLINSNEQKFQLLKNIIKFALFLSCMSKKHESTHSFASVVVLQVEGHGGVHQHVLHVPAVRAAARRRARAALRGHQPVVAGRGHLHRRVLEEEAQNRQ